MTTPTKPVAEIVAELSKMDGSSYASQIMQEAAAELTRLSKENKSLLDVIYMLIKSSGGEISISDLTIAGYERGESSISSEYDYKLNKTIYRCKP